ncbi:hypothetical protein QN277_007668 [Acacia crassicarpa]|uniref:Uncharacterized protein n=1 Tax=Acacia crassicarpa TaxID=499986 RepID=A0AAE1IVA1_9FABA|nr:hypothetical protein QN277_007668 [Acacia crassicarpa]
MILTHSGGAMQFLKFYSTLSYSLNNLSSITSRSFVSLPSTVSSTKSPKERIIVVDYLSSNFKFSKTLSLYVSERVFHARCPQQPFTVLNYFQQIGFTEAHIQLMVCRTPQILFSDINKTLKPKVEYFQRLGFDISELGKFLSSKSALLTSSLNKTLAPSVETIRNIGCNEKDLVKLLQRIGWILPSHKKIVRSVAFFQSYGIIGSQLLYLLKRQPLLFTKQESLLQNLVSRAVNLGFHVNSRMLVHAIVVVHGLSTEAFERRLKLNQIYGFSKEESLQMFRRAPYLLRSAEERVKFGFEFFLNEVMLPKSVLVQRPMILLYSMEDRVIPRYRILQLLISENLLKKNPSFVEMLEMREDTFLKKYILKFRHNAETLLMAYEVHRLEGFS